MNLLEISSAEEAPKRIGEPMLPVPVSSGQRAKKSKKSKGKAADKNVGPVLPYGGKAHKKAPRSTTGTPPVSSSSDKVAGPSRRRDSPHPSNVRVESGESSHWGQGVTYPVGTLRVHGEF